MTYETPNRRFLVGLALVVGSAIAADQPLAKISVDQARVMALQHASGAISKEEYEEEDAAWRYSFDVKEDGRIHEIGIDSNDGRVVENSWEDEDGDED